MKSTQQFVRVIRVTLGGHDDPIGTRNGLLQCDVSHSRCPIGVLLLILQLQCKRIETGLRISKRKQRGIGENRGSENQGRREKTSLVPWRTRSRGRMRALSFTNSWSNFMPHERQKPDTAASLIVYGKGESCEERAGTAEAGLRACDNDEDDGGTSGVKGVRG